MKNLLNQLSIRTQITLLSALLVILILFVGINAILDAKHSVKETDLTYQGVTVPANYLMLMQVNLQRMRYYNMMRFALPEKREDGLEKMRKYRKEAEENWRKYENTLEFFATPTELEHVDRIKASADEFWRTMDELDRLSPEDPKYRDVLVNSATITNKMFVALRELITYLSDTSAPERFAFLSGKSERDAQMTMILMGIAVIIAIVITLVISSSIQTNLSQALKLSNAVANKQLNTTIAAASDGNEVGRLINSMRDMQTSMRGVISNMGNSSRSLTEAFAQLSKVAAEIQSSSHQQSEAASSAAAAVEELTVSIDQVNVKASSTRHAAQEARSQSQESSAVIRKTSDQVQSIAETMQTSVKLAENLGERSQQIGVIVNTIRDIADQTNLLALNAAIEAARAGEQGRGFAVVADEVRKLAERTASSTEEIGNVINGIRAGIQTMVDNMKDSEAQVSDGVAMAEQAKAAIDSITRSSENVLELIGAIADALNEQSAASQQVAKNVEHIAQMAENNTSSVTNASAVVGNIDRLASTLHKDVAQFRL